jgi:type IV pilus assembly protein PilX
MMPLAPASHELLGTPPRATRGFVLVVALIFLLLLTLLGISALNTTSLQEKMAQNIREKTLATQGAEAGLQLAERWVRSLRSEQNFLTAYGSGTNDGLHRSGLNSYHKPIWVSINWLGLNADVQQYPGVPFAAGGTFVASTAMNPQLVPDQPRYIIEYVQDTKCGDETGADLNVAPPEGFCPVLRITSRATGTARTGVTIAQTTMQKRF